MSADLFDAIDLVGDWTLAFEAAGASDALDFRGRVSDDGGEVRFSFSRRGEELDVALLELRSQATFLWRRGSRPSDEVRIKLGPAGPGRLAGSLHHPTGLFDIELRGELRPTAEDGAEPSEPISPALEIADAILELDEGSIQLEYPRLDASSADYLKARDLDRNETLTWLNAPPLLLSTELPLATDDEPMPPGRYSLWLRRIDDDEWLLVANRRLGPRGNDYQSGTDVAVWSVESRRTEATSMQATLQDLGDSVQFRLAWGRFEWTTSWTPGR